MSRFPHRQFMRSAIERESEAHRALLAGNPDGARQAFAAAADLYRRSWEEAPAGSYGRLVGMLKAGILAGEGAVQALYAREALTDDMTTLASPTASYARALAALVEEDEAAARRFSDAMRTGSDAFERTARAVAALASRDEVGYRAALEAIVRDFERRTNHLTGVSIADTALMLERLAARREMASGVESPLLPI
jgi:hypothetical protein